MQEYWSGSLRPDKDESVESPGPNVDILVKRNIIGIGVISNPALTGKVKKAYEEISLDETRKLIAMLQEALVKAEAWR